jgi:hypothetical protein
MPITRVPKSKSFMEPTNETFFCLTLSLPLSPNLLHYLLPTWLLHSAHVDGGTAGGPSCSTDSNPSRTPRGLELPCAHLLWGRRAPCSADANPYVLPTFRSVAGALAR